MVKMQASNLKSEKLAISKSENYLFGTVQARLQAGPQRHRNKRKEHFLVTALHTFYNLSLMTVTLINTNSLQSLIQSIYHLANTQ